jgi:quinol-cytochrome oxidoreductase complex cytochrome b subunit
VGQAALLRFYVLHVIILPALAVPLIALHLWRVRRDGGLACSDPALHGEWGADQEQVMTWPHLLLRQLLVLQGTLVMVLVPSLLWDAPLQQLANPAHAPNPAKAPWYFLGVQEMVAHSAFWGGFVIPGFLFAVLLALPYLDTRPDGAGRWFSRDRRLALSVFAVVMLALLVLTATGTWFRGPNWDWQWPWAALQGHGP